ncbi:MAG: von Willebrand factor type A domain-containing protein [Anaerolineae bacterium]|nr:von Willebrand factor type A domain-containing protein [Anaerolineae bacterium]
MTRQIAFCGSLALIAAVIVLTALGMPGFLPGHQDSTTAAPQAANAQVSVNWPTALRPVAQVTFDRAMDTESVAAAIKVEPFVPLELRWKGRTLYVEPYESLVPDTRYRFILDTTATDAEGTPLGQVYHWGYVTGNPIASVVQPVRNGNRSTPLVVQFTNPMEPESVAQSLRIEPPVAGEIHWSEENTLLIFTPARPLPSESVYTVHLDGTLRDASGSQFPPVEPLQFTTPPAILAVSPLDETLYPGAVIEILFDRLMDTRATENAVQITPEVPGSFAWQGTRLIFEPDNNWEPLSAISVTVTPDARGQDGSSILSKPFSWSFHVAETAELLDTGVLSETMCDTSSSMGMDITVRPLLPHRLQAGDRVQVFAVVRNQSTCARRVYASLASDLLTVEGLTTHILILTAGEQRVTSWMARADRAGGGEVIAQAVSGIDGDVVRSHVTVQPGDDDREAIGPVGNVRVSREYLDVETGHTGDTVPIGQVVQVRLQIEMPYAAADIIVEDRLPAGLEALHPRDHAYEVQDDVVRFYAPELNAGSHTLTYLALATYGGQYNALPAEVYQSHDDGLWGRSADSALIIDADAKQGLAKMLGGGGDGGGDYYDPLGSCVGGTDVPNDEPYDAMFFEEYGVNPFVDTDEDNLSTFAVDVDTGSYTIMRYYVNDGFLPPDESVRVEEYVNYFDQEYAPPAEGEGAFAIHLDGAPSFYGSEQHHLLRVGLQGYLPSPEERPDVVLTFVIDVSGSMNRQDRLELVKDSLELLVEELRPSDRIGIAVYGSRGRKLLEHTPVSESDEILKAINRLEPEGSTNAEEGLRIGYRMAAEAFDSEAINRVILCSDGVANVGKTGHESIWEEIGSYAEQGIYLTTVGFGMGNYNDVLMEQLADHGDGFYAYVDTITEAKRLFAYELPSTLQVIARDARIQVEFNPGVVRSYRLIGYENRDIADEEFREDDVDAGEIGVGHSVTALYEIKFWEGVSSTDPAITVYVRYENPDTGETLEQNRSISWGEFASAFEEASPRFQLAAVVTEYAEVLRHSYWAKDSSLDDVLTQARRVAEYFPEDEDVSEFLQLVERATTLSDKED